MTLNKKKNKNMLECVNNKAMHLFSKQQQLLIQKTSGMKKSESYVMTHTRGCGWGLVFSVLCPFFF